MTSHTPDERDAVTWSEPPRQAGAPTLVSLFTGAGGLDAGLEIAGFNTVYATDMDRDCIETLGRTKAARIPVSVSAERRFLEDAELSLADIAELDPEHIRPLGTPPGWRPDLLAGGPPCQPFSSAGKMLSVNDPRGRLFEHFVRLANGLKPRLILFENVRGMVTARGPHGQPGEVLTLVREAFESIGYATTFALLNAADFGAPQRRVRCFMLASRQAPLPQFPEPTHAENPVPTMFGTLEPWVTLGAVLETLPRPDAADIVRPTAELAAQLAALSSGSGLKSAGAREATRPGGHWGYRQGTFIADPQRPARTVTAAAAQDWIRLPDGSLRRLTWRECSALQGFPPRWDFAGTAVSKFRQIGNAVPVRFGVVLGRSLLDALRTVAQSHAPMSAPFPASFAGAIEYTKREERRNGASRRSVRQLVADGSIDASDAKGLGSLVS